MKKGIDTIGIFVSAVCHDGEGNFLMGKRSMAARDNYGKWEFGGGAVELNENLEVALVREVREEFGTEPFCVEQIETREFVDDNGHWIGIFFAAQIDRQAVHIAEPVYDEIGWFTLDTLPSPLMSGDAERIATYVKFF
ncbi:MAG: 8-oxo-dGTP diphosphatase [Candidatus Azotimanducaceae bacterium]|jgi:8-oxo-dGTP diphosphatase